MPIRDGDAVTGYVDLISERAYHYNPGRPSDLVPMPQTNRSRANGMTSSGTQADHAGAPHSSI